LSFQEEAVLVPNKIGRAQLEIVALHAAFEQTDDVAVVWVGFKSQTSAIVHELFELRRLVKTKFFDGYLLLFAFDVVIFLVL